MDSIRSDGNGAIIIKKGMIGIILSILLILGILIGVSSSAALIRADVTRHTAQIESLVIKVDLNENHMIATEKDIANIKEDISEIKTDIKELLKR